MDPFTWTVWTKEQLLNRRYDPTDDPRFADKVDALKEKILKNVGLPEGVDERWTYGMNGALEHYAAVRGCLVGWTPLGMAVSQVKWIWFWGGLHAEGLRRLQDRENTPVKLLARYRNQVDMLPTIEFEPSADVPAALLGLLDTTPLEPYDVINIEWDGSRAVQIAGALVAFGYDVDEEGIVTLK
jgi:hypothetical protein